MEDRNLSISNQPFRGHLDKKGHRSFQTFDVKVMPLLNIDQEVLPHYAKFLFSSPPLQLYFTGQSAINWGTSISGYQKMALVTKKDIPVANWRPKMGLVTKKKFQ